MAAVLLDLQYRELDVLSQALPWQAGPVLQSGYTKEMQLELLLLCFGVANLSVFQS
jgi:hypothetical protein